MFTSESLLTSIVPRHKGGGQEIVIERSDLNGSSGG